MLSNHPSYPRPNISPIAAKYVTHFMLVLNYLEIKDIDNGMRRYRTIFAIKKHKFDSPRAKVTAIGTPYASASIASGRPSIYTRF